MDKHYGFGTIALWWLGQMGLMVKAGGTTICVDYYASPDEARQVEPPIAADELKGIDIFLGTHDHLDHIDHDAGKIWAKLTVMQSSFSHENIWQLF